jgi:hypothetical protein
VLFTVARSQPSPQHSLYFIYILLFPIQRLTPLFIIGYIGEFEIIDDHRSGKIIIQLNGRLNKTGVISPRYNIQVSQIESWVNLLLPARGFGIIILVWTQSLYVSYLANLICYRPPPRASWIMKRPGERTSVEKYWDMFTSPSWFVSGDSLH